MFKLDVQLINLLLRMPLSKIHTVLLASSLTIYLASECTALVVALTIVIIDVDRPTSFPGRRSSFSLLVVDVQVYRLVRAIIMRLR